jgi:hypothetical protein
MIMPEPLASYQSSGRVTVEVDAEQDSLPQSRPMTLASEHG